MFDKNDKTLHIYYVLIHVALGLLLLASVVGAVICFAAGRDYIVVGIAILFGGAIISLISYVVARAIFGLFVDIKLIRNKLYGADNRGIEKYYKYTTDPLDEHVGSSQPQPVQPVRQPQFASSADGDEDKFTRIERFKELRDKGVIGDDEFQAIKRRLLKGELIGENEYQDIKREIAEEKKVASKMPNKHTW